MWVGTEREYTDASVHSGRPTTVSHDTVNRNTFYLSATKRAFLPSVTVDGVTTLVDTSDGQVDVNWTQSKSVQVAMYLLDEQTRKLYWPVALDTQRSIHDETFGYRALRCVIA